MSGSGMGVAPGSSGWIASATRLTLTSFIPLSPSSATIASHPPSEDSSATIGGPGGASAGSAIGSAVAGSTTVRAWLSVGPVIAR